MAAQSRKMIAQSRELAARTAREAAELTQVVASGQRAIGESLRSLSATSGQGRQLDRVLTSDHVQKARSHVVESEEHVRRQRRLVADLERDGHETALARELLTYFEEILLAHVAVHDRLIAELF